MVRGADEPVADLTEHLVVHRGIRVDLARLAGAARDLASTPPDRDAACPRGLSDYLASITAMVDSLCRVDSDVLSPVLIGLVGNPCAVPSVDGAALRILMHRAGATAAAEATPTGLGSSSRAAATGLGPGSRAAATGLEPGSGAAAALAVTLERAADAAIAFTVRQERAVHPLIREYMRAEDYRWVRDQFLTALPAGLLAFAVPWTLRHASSAERSRLLDHRDPAICVTQQIFERRFAVLEGLAFGDDHLRRRPIGP